MAPSTIGTFLRAFTFGHLRQLDVVLGEALRRAWAMGAGPGDEPVVFDIDSTICEVHGYQKQGASRSEEHTSELQSLMRISYAVFCLKKKKNTKKTRIKDI